MADLHVVAVVALVSVFMRLVGLPLFLFVVGVLCLIFAGCAMAALWEWLRK